MNEREREREREREIEICRAFGSVFLSIYLLVLSND